MVRTKWIASLAVALTLSLQTVVSVASTPVPPEFSLVLNDSTEFEVNENSEMRQYISFSKAHESKFDFTLTTSTSVYMSLYRIDSEEEIATFDSLESGISPGQTITGTLDFPSCEFQSQEQCNLFHLEVLLYATASPDESEATAFSFFILEKTNNNEANASIEWESGEELCAGSNLGQRWIQLPCDQLEPPSIIGYESASRQQHYLEGDWVPVFGDTVFYPVTDNLPVFRFFDHELTLDICSLTSPISRTQSRLCLEISAPYLPSPVVQDKGTQAFYARILSECSFSLEEDDEFSGDPDLPCSQAVSVTYPEGAQDQSATLLKQDHRFVEQYQESVDLQTPFMLESNSDNAGTYLLDNEICQTPELNSPPRDLCQRVWNLQASFVDQNEVSRSYSLNLIILDDIFFDQGQPQVPPLTSQLFTDTPSVELESFPFQLPDLPSAWVQLPEHEDWRSEFFGPMKANHRLVGWNSSANLTSEYFLDFYYPFVQEETIYPIWKPIYNVNFINGNNSQTQEAWGEQTLVDVAPATPDGALGWGLSANGPVVSQNFTFDQQTDFYAVFPAPAINNPSPEPAPDASTTPSAPVNQTPSVLAPQAPTTKTSVKISFENGATEITASIPAGYVNRNARIEQRVLVNGKVRYTTLARGWTHFDKTTKDQSKAVMSFKFQKKLESSDRFRVVVRGVTVIKSFGDGKPAWR